MGIVFAFIANTMFAFSINLYPGLVTVLLLVIVTFKWGINWFILSGYTIYFAGIVFLMPDIPKWHFFTTFPYLPVLAIIASLTSNYIYRKRKVILYPLLLLLPAIPMLEKFYFAPRYWINYEAQTFLNIPLGEYVVQTTNGDSVLLKDVLGKESKLAMIWSESCAYCHIEMEMLSEWNTSKQKKCIAIYSFERGSYKAFKEHAHKGPKNIQYLYDNNAKLTYALKIKSQPANLFIDKDHILRKIVFGYYKEDKEFYMDNFSEFLDELDNWAKK